MSLRLHSALNAWGCADFPQVLRDDLLGNDALFNPLQRAMAHGSYALVEESTFMVLRTADDGLALQIDAAVSYASIIPGCACEADPTPMSELPECATLRIRIDRGTAEATVHLLAD